MKLGKLESRLKGFTLTFLEIGGTFLLIHMSFIL
jgi:hypothetical protein